VTVDLPLKRLVAITGVSGSGKSTLARDVPARQPAVHQHARRAAELAGLREDRRLGLDRPRPRGRPDADRQDAALVPGDLHRLLGHDQEALRRDARVEGARLRAGALQLQHRRGRCPGCEGQGVKTIEMSFLPDVKLPCDVCHGERFNAETLAVSWRGKSIGDVLKMEVDEAVDFFASMPNIAHPLQLLKDVGLGYLTLGQPSPTLSGGEAQRIKLVTELSKVRDDVGKRGNKAPHTLYVLDEPTVGLHMADVERLIRVLHRLVDGGHRWS
jgi:excinuclease ABC subunit A